MPRPVFLALLALILQSPVGAVLRAGETPEFRASPEQEAYFEQRVRPILVARCFECHGEKKQEGGLRLDSRPALLKDGDFGPAIVAGKPEASRLIEVVGYGDPIKMPPKEQLSSDEIATLTEWIRIGAPFPASQSSSAPALGQSATPAGIRKARETHWAFQPVQRSAPPSADATGWAQTSIDQFVVAKLNSAGLKPNPRTDRRTFLRRVTFDLIGLPPTADEVAAFESDPSPDAFATVVDRLLASPHYGERWGRHWLDVARYADTKGYVFTEERKFAYSYTYRDYVIRSFNSDLPFDRFLLEQLAADQLPLGDDKAPLAAMGFLTLGRRFGNKENDIIDDRIDVVARGLMGLTVACARCHDHKYDPIPTDDYYSLFGVFASSIEPNDLPQIGQPTDIEGFRAYEQELQKLEAAIENFQHGTHVSMVNDARARSADYLAAVVRLAGRQPPDDKDPSLATTRMRGAFIRRWQAFLSNTAKQSHPVFGPWHTMAELPADGFARDAAPIIAALNDAPGAEPRTNPLIKAALQGAPPQSMADVAAVYGKLLADAHSQWLKLQESTTGSPPAALPDAAAEELRQIVYADNNPTALTFEEARRSFDRAIRDEIAKLRKAVDNFKASSPAAPPRAMVLNDAPQPKQAKVLIRGNSSRPGKDVPRRFLQVLQPEDARPFQQGSGRLELAQAIASPHNPLTPRVIVNRVWLHHFGEGLVRTPSDFGARGELPSHPELLDYLAGTFIDEGWSIKKLHRRILLSAVYQQTSDDRDDGIQADPENRLLWQMNRQRLEFEPLRDSLLAVSGRLDRTITGRPIDLFAAPFTTRRAVYGFIDRQDLPGTLRIFDFASPDVSMPRRPETTVPQQALFGMNSSFVIEQARELAAHPDVTAATEAAAQVQAFYRLIFARPAEAAEIAAGVGFLSTPQPTELPPTADWQYGYGQYDEAAKLTKTFAAFPHFQEGSWRGGMQLPDAALGWTLLNADGGHPGGSPQLAAIRRWTAPREGAIRVAATFSHPAEEGDGVRGRVVSSRAGELGSWTIHHGQVETKLDRVEVVQGETIDFIVDCRSNESHDSFSWPPTIVLTTTTAAGAGASQQWVATTDFRGPANPAATLSPLEQYAQALLLTNEFVFVD